MPAVEARWPPAEKPMIAILCGSRPHRLALRANRPDRPAGVIEHRGMMIARAESVLEDERRDPQRVEPLGDLLPFVVDRQHPVAAPRADDDGRTRGCSRVSAGKSSGSERPCRGRSLSHRAFRWARAESPSELSPAHRRVSALPWHTMMMAKDVATLTTMLPIRREIE